MNSPVLPAPPRFSIESVREISDESENLIARGRSGSSGELGGELSERKCALDNSDKEQLIEIR